MKAVGLEMRMRMESIEAGFGCRYEYLPLLNIIFGVRVGLTLDSRQDSPRGDPIR